MLSGLVGLTSPHGVTSQKTNTGIFTTVTVSGLTKTSSLYTCCDLRNLLYVNMLCKISEEKCQQFLASEASPSEIVL
jgi:hypothetical protein